MSLHGHYDCLILVPYIAHCKQEVSCVLMCVCVCGGGGGGGVGEGGGGVMKNAPCSGTKNMMYCTTLAIQAEWQKDIPAGMSVAYQKQIWISPLKQVICIAHAFT